MAHQTLMRLTASKIRRLMIMPYDLADTKSAAAGLAEKKSVSHPPTVGDMNPHTKPQALISANAAPVFAGSIPFRSIGIQYMTGIHIPLPMPNSANPAIDAYTDTLANSTAARTPKNLNICPHRSTGLRLPLR